MSVKNKNNYSADNSELKLSDVKLRYTCASYPPEYIDVGLKYGFGSDYKGVYFTDGKISYYKDLSFIKMLFTPIGVTWEQIENKLK